MSEKNASLIFIKETDSTNSHLLRIMDSLPSYSMLVAEKQSAGKGRRGNHWLSSSGNFYGSMLFKNPPMPSSAGTWIASVAALNVIREYTTDHNVSIKWPNDIYYSGKKLCGILCETRNDSSNNPEAFVMGIGVNINMNREEASVINKPATSLYIETGIKHDIKIFAAKLAASLIKFYEETAAKGADFIFELWKKENFLPGMNISVSLENAKFFDGTAVDILPDGRLLFKPEHGAEMALSCADISIKSFSSQS